MRERQQRLLDGHQVVRRLKQWGAELGFSQIGIAGIDLAQAEDGLTAWLAAGFHGRMHYMQRHGLKRARPAELVPGTLSVISARMDYLPRRSQAGDRRAGPAPDRPDDAAARDDWTVREAAALREPGTAVVSIYARGRDYHKVLRSRLQALADRLRAEIGDFGHRVFTDSAPVLEVELAARAGLGWRGKHTLALSRDGGSMFFVGEIFCDLQLPHDEPASEHCGSCEACIDACPTRAIVAPMKLDARRCISYLTIEHPGSIDVELRPLIGNRIYGCDDCQLACPWNKFARRSPLPDFDERDGFAHATLLELWGWSEEAFGRRTEGSAIRRIGYSRWRRNLAVAIGNALAAADDPVVRSALAAALDGCDDEVVREHIAWALEQRPVTPAVAAAPASAAG